MKPVKPPRINGRVPVLSAQEAVNYIPDEATLCVLGAGGGILEATTLITALADKYKQTQTPRNLSIISPTGLGDRADRGISPLAQEGLVKWALCGHWGQSPRISELAEQNKIIAYNYPQGVLTQTLRAAAAHQPGIISDIGIGTFVDPRQQGGKLNEVTKEDLIKLVEFDNKEYLYYKAIAPDIAFIRATTCDSVSSCIVVRPCTFFIQPIMVWASGRSARIVRISASFSFSMSPVISAIRFGVFSFRISSCRTGLVILALMNSVSSSM